MKLNRTSMRALVASGVSAAVIGSGAAAYAIFDAATSVSAAPAPSSAAAEPTAAVAPLASGSSDDGLAAARVKEGAGASAGTGTGASAGSGAAARPAALRQLGRLVIGEVTAVSSTRGAASAGVISVQTPDGTTVTANLAKRTRIYAYHGPGSKPTTETLAQLRPDELVAVRIVERRAGSGTGSSATGAGSSATASGSARTGVVTTATSSSPAGTPYASLIVDLGFTASGTSNS